MEHYSTVMTQKLKLEVLEGPQSQGNIGTAQQQELELELLTLLFLMVREVASLLREEALKNHWRNIESIKISQHQVSSPDISTIN